MLLNLPVPHSLQKGGSSDMTEINIFNTCQEEYKEKQLWGFHPAQCSRLVNEHLEKKCLVAGVCIVRIYLAPGKEAEQNPSQTLVEELPCCLNRL